MSTRALPEMPDDFPNFTENSAVAIVDTLITMLLHERACLSDPVWRPTALARIEKVRRALISHGNAPYSPGVGRQLLVDTIDKARSLDAPIAARVDFACVVLQEAVPGARISRELVRDAVSLRGEERTTAVRGLARALGCDAPSLDTLLRQARKELSESRRRPAKRK